MNPLEHARRLNQRWKAEVALMAAIAPAPRYRWPLFVRLGGTPANFSWQDTAIIARALEVAHERGRDICAKLAAMLLAEDGLWDGSDLRRTPNGMRWGSGSLAFIFTKTGGRFDEASMIGDALASVREMPRFIEPTTRQEAA